MKYRKMESAKLVSDGYEEGGCCKWSYKKSFITFIAVIAVIALLMYFRPNYLFELNNIWIDNKKDQGNATLGIFNGSNDSYFIINPVRLCELSSSEGRSDNYSREVKVLVLISSSPADRELRQAVRDTWGSLAREPKSPLRLAFIVGTSQNETMTDWIQKEDRIYNDIIQPDLPDSKQNHTMKSAALLRWAAHYCPQAEFILKTDDNVFVDINSLLRILTNDQRYKNNTPFIGGYTREKTPLQQSTKSHREAEFDISTTVAPTRSVYGSTYVIDAAAIQPLYQITHEREFEFPFDSLFLTDAGINILDDDRFWRHPPPRDWSNFKGSVCACGYDPPEMHSLWKQFVDDAVLSFILQDFRKCCP